MLCRGWDGLGDVQVKDSMLHRQGCLSGCSVCKVHPTATPECPEEGFSYGRVPRGQQCTKEAAGRGSQIDHNILSPTSMQQGILERQNKDNRCARWRKKKAAVKISNP